MRRRRGPGLVGTMARTAVIAGTATAVAGSVSGKQHQKAAAQQNAAAAQQQQMEMQAQLNAMQSQQVAAAIAPAPTAGGLSPEAMAQLQQLAALKDAGVLTQEEFDRQKMLILG